jgi:hypothetical protein
MRRFAAAHAPNPIWGSALPQFAAPPADKAEDEPGFRPAPAEARVILFLDYDGVLHPDPCFD